MAIRRPSVNRQSGLVFQDFLYHGSVSEGNLRYVLAKWDGEDFTESSQTFDYTLTPVRGGPIIARLDYTLLGKSITIDHWEVNWRDEWPIRLIIQFLANCLYPSSQGYVIRVNKTSYSFWASEHFTPLTNSSSDFMVYNDGNS